MAACSSMVQSVWPRSSLPLDWTMECSTRRATPHPIHVSTSLLVLPRNFKIAFTFWFALVQAFIAKAKGVLWLLKSLSRRQCIVNLFLTKCPTLSGFALEGVCTVQPKGLIAIKLISWINSISWWMLFLHYYAIIKRRKYAWKWNLKIIMCIMDFTSTESLLGIDYLFQRFPRVLVESRSIFLHIPVVTMRKRGKAFTDVSPPSKNGLS